MTTTRLLARAIADGRTRGHPRRSWPATASPGTATTATRSLTEESDSRGDSLLTRVTREWQAAADPAVEAGARVCVLRTSPVMDRRSEPLRQLRLLFRLGLGARLGHGEQYMPMISLRDWVGGVVHLAEHDTAHGPFNLTCPETPTNAEFTQALAAAVHRPALVVTPRSLLKVAAGQMAPELLGSLNVRPAALERAGYGFRDRDVDGRTRRRAGLSADPRHPPLPRDPTEHDGPPRRPVPGQPGPNPAARPRPRARPGRSPRARSGRWCGLAPSRRAPASAGRAPAARARRTAASIARSRRPAEDPVV